MRTTSQSASRNEMQETVFHFFESTNCIQKYYTAKGTFSRIFKISFLSFALFFIGIQYVDASHFRGGTITWQETGNPNEIEFTITSSWRGTLIGNINFYFGDGNSVNAGVGITTATNTAENWATTVHTITHTYASDGNYTAYFESCCRISGLGINSNDDYRVETIVNIGNPYGGNDSPVSSVPTIINMPVNQNPAVYNFNSIDPNGDPMQFRLATTAESGMNSPSNGGLISIDPVTGVLSFNTTGLSIGALYASSIVVEDLDVATSNVKSKSMLDVMIRIVGSSLPPVFDPPTPADGTTYSIAPGTPFNLTVQASDPDGAGNPGGDVTLQVAGTPATVSFNPALPTPAANPVSTNLSWTPTLSETGTYLFTFLAQDDLGIQTTISVSIVVSSAPPFDIPPTPPNNTLFCTEGGQLVNPTIQATDIDPLQTVTLGARILTPSNLTTPPPPYSNGGLYISSTVPAGISTALATQTTTANSSTSNINWNVTDADWGIYEIEYTATNGAGDESVLTHVYIVDRAPTFVTATPVGETANVGVPYSIVIQATDADDIYGDAVNFADAARPYVTIPAWLTLTDNDNGTATLSGTPTTGDLGVHNVNLEIHDRTSHYQHTHCKWDFMNFDITVTNVPTCTPSLSGCPANIEVCGAQAISWTDPTYDMTCNYSMTSSHTSGSNFGVGTTTVTYDLSDASGTVLTSCSFDVIINSNPLIDVNELIHSTDFCTYTKSVCTEVINQSNLVAPISYQWSGGLGSNGIEPVTGPGIYAVTVTDANGCTASGQAEVTNIYEYDVLADNTVNLKYSEIETNALVWGKNNTGRLTRASSIDGAFVAPKIVAQSTSTIATPIETQAKVDFPTLIENDQSCPVNHVIIPHNQTMTLSGDAYKVITVFDGATLIIDSPIFYAHTIQTRKNTTIEFTQPTTVVLKDDLMIGANGMVNTADQPVIFYTGDDCRVTLGTLFNGNVYAKGNITASGLRTRMCVMNGNFVALGGVTGTQYAEFHPGTHCYMGVATPPSCTALMATSDPHEKVSEIHELNMSHFDTRRGNSSFDASEKLSMSVSPNPASSQVQINLHGLQSDYQMRIFDQIGKLHWQSYGNQHDQKINLNLEQLRLETGVYFVKISTTTDQIVKQILVSK